MQNPANKYIACVWKYANGFRVVQKRAFKTDWGAIRFAEEASQQKGVTEVTVTMPHKKVGAWGAQMGSARNGEFTFNIDKEQNTMSKAKTKAASDDTGEDVSTQGKKGQRAPRAKRERVTRPVEWVDLLDMADLAIKNVDMKYRPALPAKVAFEDNFCDAYARFLSGSRRTHPGSQARPFSNDELVERRAYVRKAIGAVVAGKPQPKPSFSPLVKATKEKKAKKADAPKSTPKASPKKASATPKQRKASETKKNADRKAAAKAAAAKRSVKAKTIKTKKRGAK